MSVHSYFSECCTITKLLRSENTTKSSFPIKNAIYFDLHNTLI